MKIERVVIKNLEELYEDLQNLVELIVDEDEGKPCYKCLCVADIIEHIQYSMTTLRIKLADGERLEGLDNGNEYVR